METVENLSEHVTAVANNLCLQEQQPGGTFNRFSKAKLDKTCPNMCTSRRTQF